MKTKIIILPLAMFVLIIFDLTNGFTQENSIDSLYTILQTEKEDSMKVKALLDLSKAYLNISSDTAIMYALQSKDLSEKIKFDRGKANALKSVGNAYYYKGKYRDALTFWNKSLSVFESIGDKYGEANMYSNIGAIYFTQGDDEPALYNFLKSLHIAEQINDKKRIATLCSNIGALYSRKSGTYYKAREFLFRGLMLSEELGDKEIIGSINLNLGAFYMNKNLNDSAILYLNKSILNWQNNRNLPGALTSLGKVYSTKKQYDLAKKKFKEAFEIATKLNSNLDITQSLLGLANINYQEQQFNQAIKDYKQAELIAKEMDAKEELKQTYYGLAMSNAKILDFKDAYFYMNYYSIIKDSIYNIATDKKLSGLEYNFEIKNKETKINLLQKDKELQELNLKKEKSAKSAISIALALIFIIAIIIFRYYRVKIKTNNILNNQNKEINEAYKELKSTQSQLIQSEKMASLGELTAGIAHEIQNPLNFVNNFSEVNKELLAEMKDEIEKGNIDEVKALANDVIDNEQKINHHGKRADAIVKGMLQHSRSSSGVKEPTDINALCDEYLRLSYHGLRAKDKSFNATFKTDFDPSPGKVNIIPQDIGRVVLNLLTNAFYVVDEKKKSGIENYEPTVSVSTKKINDNVEIKISDNGNGIPKKVLDKIFQPFFTTKPTGQGTGLGLSLSYDIIKAHGGEIKVETKEEEGTEFIISLPLKHMH